MGLSWIGGAIKTRRALRSIQLAQLEPLLRVRGTRFVSLQYTRCEAEIEALAQQTGLVVRHWPEAIADYDETASLVDALDLVITVTTSIVHMAGALGKPVWVLVPTVPEWRYMRTGTTMPWYPTARLFRQQNLWDWRPVMQEVHKQLCFAVARIQKVGDA